MRIRRIGIGLLCSIFIVFGYSCKTYSYPEARLIIPSTRSIPETPPISTYGPQKEVEIAETIITPASVQPVEVTTAEDSQRVVYEVIVEEPRLSLPEERCSKTIRYGPYSNIAEVVRNNRSPDVFENRYTPSEGPFDQVASDRFCIA